MQLHSQPSIKMYISQAELLYTLLFIPSTSKWYALMNFELYHSKQGKQAWKYICTLVLLKKKKSAIKKDTGLNIGKAWVLILPIQLCNVILDEAGDFRASFSASEGYDYLPTWWSQKCIWIYSPICLLQVLQWFYRWKVNFSTRSHNHMSIFYY